MESLTIGRWPTRAASLSNRIHFRPKASTLFMSSTATVRLTVDQVVSYSEMQLAHI